MSAGTKMDTIIIGAGPAGLAVAGRMRSKNLPFLLLEQSDKISSTWYDHYDRLHLHTVKELSHLPHLPFPDNYPRYVPRDLLIEYFNAYAKHFEINPVFNQRVDHIQKSDSGYIVKTTLGQEYQASKIVISTGVNRVPINPTWKNQDLFRGTISHSRSYKNPTPYKGKKVLVIGMGNTGAEIALDLAEHEIPALLSVRGPISLVPRDLSGRPTQITAKQLAKLPLGLGDWLGSQIRKIYYGDLTKYGLTPSKMHPAVQLRETGKTPIIDIGTIKKIKEGKIKVVPEVNSFFDKGIIDINDGKQEVDSVILATGYQAQLDDFLFDTAGLLDSFGVPKSPVGEDQYDGLFFVGFDNYKLGGILGTIFTDSKIVVDAIREK